MHFIIMTKSKPFDTQKLPLSTTMLFSNLFHHCEDFNKRKDKFIENKSVQIDGIEWSISKNECEKYYVIMQNISEAYRCNCMC